MRRSPQESGAATRTCRTFEVHVKRAIWCVPWIIFKSSMLGSASSDGLRLCASSRHAHPSSHGAKRVRLGDAKRFRNLKILEMSFGISMTSTKISDYAPGRPPPPLSTMATANCNVILLRCARNLSRAASLALASSKRFRNEVSQNAMSCVVTKRFDVHTPRFHRLVGCVLGSCRQHWLCLVCRPCFASEIQSEP
jgi:hypothetical protein